MRFVSSIKEGLPLQDAHDTWEISIKTAMMARNLETHSAIIVPIISKPCAVAPSNTSFTSAVVSNAILTLECRV